MGPRSTLTPAPPLPHEALIVRNPLAAVADRLPHLLNLCRATQGVAAKLSLGLPTTVDRTAEILRDHVWTLCITLPSASGLDPALCRHFLLSCSAWHKVPPSP